MWGVLNHGPLNAVWNPGTVSSGAPDTEAGLCSPVILTAILQPL